MQTPPHRGILIGLAFCSALLGAAPADAFSLFGIHLWGARDDEDAFEVIDPLHYTVTLNGLGRRGRPRAPAPVRLLALDRPRDAGLRQRRAALQGPRRLPPAPGRALRRRLLRPGDQHPRRRPGGLRRHARRRVSPERPGGDQRRRRTAVPVRRHPHRQRAARPIRRPRAPTARLDRLSRPASRRARG